MKKSVLVLNASFEPLTMVTLARAIQKILDGQAEAVEESEIVIHGVSIEIKKPLVIRLLKQRNVPRMLPVPLSRKAILVRDGHTCQYCGGKEDLTIDHVLPKARGGKTEWNNVVTCCLPCNRKKGNRLLEHTDMVLRSNPYQPKFRDFAVPEEGRKYFNLRNL